MTATCRYCDLEADDVGVCVGVCNWIADGHVHDSDSDEGDNFGGGQRDYHVSRGVSVVELCMRTPTQVLSNVKLTVICAISLDKRCKDETLSTLSYKEELTRVKSSSDGGLELNIDEEDVKDLRVQIDAHVSFEDSLSDLSENMSTEFSSCEEISNTETAGGADVVNGSKRRVTEAQIFPIASVENVDAYQTSLRSLK
ncbi:hypothetical protein ACLOJK_031596 [Asimina triloba]